MTTLLRLPSTAKADTAVDKPLTRQLKDERDGRLFGCQGALFFPSLSAAQLVGVGKEVTNDRMTCVRVVSGLINPFTHFLARPLPLTEMCWSRCLGRRGIKEGVAVWR